jgi:hypothetical protein
MDMSLYEYQDVIASKWALFFAGFSLYLTLLFAYLTVAYVVGKKLSRFQLIAITAIYLPSIVMAAGTTLGLGQETAQLEASMFEVYGVGSPREVVQNVGTPVTAVVFLSAIVLSLAFMWKIRKRADI